MKIQPDPQIIPRDECQSKYFPVVIDPCFHHPILCSIPLILHSYLYIASYDLGKIAYSDSSLDFEKKSF